MEDKQLSEFCKAAALLFDNGYGGPARALLAGVLMHPSLNDPAPRAALPIDAFGVPADGESEEEGSSDEDPGPRLCIKCGNKLKAQNTRDTCYRCVKAPKHPRPRPCATGVDCGKMVRGDNKSGYCVKCYNRIIAREKGRQRRGVEWGVCSIAGCDTRIRLDNSTGLCTRCYPKYKWQFADRTRPPSKKARIRRLKDCVTCGAKFSMVGNGKYCDGCRTRGASVGNGSYNGYKPGKPDIRWQELVWEQALKEEAQETAALDGELLANGWRFCPEQDRWVRSEDAEDILRMDHRVGVAAWEEGE